MRERLFPTRDDLDRVSRTRPIVVSRVCGHAVVVNSAALALVSDAVAAAGMGDGEFRLGSAHIHARDGVVRRADGVLAGSTLTLRDAVVNLCALGVSPAQALSAATAVPARLAGVPELGRLVVGEPADVLVLDDRLEVVRVLPASASRIANE